MKGKEAQHMRRIIAEDPEWFVLFSFKNNYFSFRTLSFSMEKNLTSTVCLEKRGTDKEKPS